MAQKENRFTGLAHDTVLTTGNSDDGGGSILQAVVKGSTAPAAQILVDTVTVPPGETSSIKLTPGASGNQNYVEWTDTGSAHINASFWFRMDTVNGSLVQFPLLWRASSGDTHLCRLELGSTQLLRINASAVVATAGTAIAINTWYWMRFYWANVSNTVASTATLDVYSATGVLLFTVSGSALAAVAGTVGRVDYGKRSSATFGNIWFGRIRANIGSATPDTFPSTNVVPTCSAGTDQTSIEAYSTVTVTGTDSDADGTVTSRTWRVISTTNGAASPTLSGSGAVQTFEAPGTIAGTVVTLGYQVTDNLGATSTEDTVTVSVLPVTERAVIGGVEVPMKVATVAADGVSVTLYSAHNEAVITPDQVSETFSLTTGIRFKVLSAAKAYGVRYFRGSTHDAGTGHTGQLWEATDATVGTMIVEKAYPAPTGGGWQEVLFDTPIDLTPETWYVAGTYHPQGRYCATLGWFIESNGNAPFTNGPLYIPATGEAENNCYEYGTGAVAPSQTFSGSSYWNDIIIGVEA